MFSFISENMISILFGIAGFAIVIILYPVLEGFFVKKITERIDWVSDKFEKLYLRRLKNKQYVIGFGIGPAIILFLIGYMLTYSMPGYILVVVTASLTFAGWFIPKLIISIIHARRITKFNDQLIDALGMLSNSLQAGLSLMQGIQVIVKNMPNPISQEFALVLSEHSVGATLDEALVNMSNRVESDDLGMVVNSITILRETGGNLVETFDTMTNTIRERTKLDGKIKAMTSMGITQGAMMIGFPYILAFAFYTLNPKGMSLFITTKIGWLLILLALILQGLGAFTIKKIVTIEI